MSVQRIPHKANGQTPLLACDAIAREIVQFVERNQWSCFAVQCLSAELHWQPHRTPEAACDMIRHPCDRRDRINNLCGDFGRCIGIAAGTGGTNE